MKVTFFHVCGENHSMIIGTVSPIVAGQQLSGQLSYSRQTEYKYIVSLKHRIKNKRLTMKSISEHLTTYASYHRDPRNIATHFIGIPVIIFAVTILLSRPLISMALFDLSPAIVLAAIACVYYLKLDLFLGLVMTCLLSISVWFAAAIAESSTLSWLGWGIGLFVVGWILQFVGHFYEGKKPAFVDDIMGLAVGPLFVVAEAVFMLGLKPELKRVVEKGAGPIAIQTKKIMA